MLFHFIRCDMSGWWCWDESRFRRNQALISILAQNKKIYCNIILEGPPQPISDWNEEFYGMGEDSFLLDLIFNKEL